MPLSSDLLGAHPSSMSSPMSWQKRTVPWVLALFVGSLLVWLTHYISGDPDSRFYCFLVEQLHAKPMREWIAPQWMWEQGIPPGQFVKDHLIGHLVPALLLARLGVPAPQALYLVNLVYSIVVFFLLADLCKRYVSDVCAQACLLALQILPIAFLYRVRANHEMLVLLSILLGLCSAVRMRENKLFALGVLLATQILFLVKGVVFFMVPATVMTVWLASAASLKRRDHFLFWGVAGGSALSVIPTALAYESWFSAVTGETFFSYYWSLQVVGRSIAINGNELFPVPVQKLVNLFYYIGSCFWYAAPWTLLLVSRAGLRKFEKRRRGKLATGQGESSEPRKPLNALKLHNARKNLAMSARQMLNRAFVLAQTWPLFTILGGSCLLYVGLFSASNRTGVRYIFPAYFLLGTLCFAQIWQATQVDGKNSQLKVALIKMAQRPWWSAGVWLLGVMFNVFFAGYKAK